MNTSNQESASKEAKLTVAQAQALAAAAAHPRGIVEPASEATERAGQSRTLKTLAKRGLIQQLNADAEGEAAPDDL